MSASKMTVSYHLIHGDPVQFELDVDQGRRRNLASNIEAALSSNFVGVLMDKKLTIIPSQNIKTIEISPVEDLLIKGVVVDGKPIES